MPDTIEMMKRLPGMLQNYWETDPVNAGTRGLIRGLRDVVGLQSPSSQSDSVMEPRGSDEERMVRGVTGAVVPAAAGAMIAVKPLLAALRAAPIATNLGIGAGATALTGDPTNMVNSPVMQALTYSPDAEASVFTDSLKGIDKFLAAHGTPHIFPPTETNPLGAFDWSKMNTGEGAQAFGYGHYLAGDEKISRVHYRDRLVKDINDSLLSPSREYDAQVKALREKAVKDAMENGELNPLGDKKMNPRMEHAIVSKVAGGKNWSKSLAKTFDENEKNKFIDSISTGYGNVSPRSKQISDWAKSIPAEQLYSAEIFPKIKEFAAEEKRAKNVLSKLNAKAQLTVNELEDADTTKLQASYGAKDWNELSGLAKNDPEAYQKYLVDRENLSAKYSKMATDEYNRLLSSLPPGKVDELKELSGSSVGKSLESKAKAALALRTSEEARMSKKFSEVDTSTLGDRPDPSLEPEKKVGALYTVEVDESPFNLLPLNIPMSELKEDMPHVYDAVKSSMGGLGREIDQYQTPMEIIEELRAKKSAVGEKFSKDLNAKGIQGNMYLSKGRNKMSTDREFDPKEFNYVMYNDEVAKIISRELGRRRK